MDNFVIDRCEGFQAIFMNWTVEQPGFQPATFDAVAEALREADRDPNIACSLFFGVPRCFCLGTDATAFGQVSALSRLSETVLRFFQALISARKPMIAAVDGAAVGLGMTMLCHFDVVFATPESVFKAPFAEWGLAPEAASSLLLPEELGYRKAFEIFCLGAEAHGSGSRTPRPHYARRRPERLAGDGLRCGDADCAASGPLSLLDARAAAPATREADPQSADRNGRLPRTARRGFDPAASQGDGARRQDDDGRSGFSGLTGEQGAAIRPFENRADTDKTKCCLEERQI